jgi:DNA-binding response OmpR family regulator
MPAKILLVDDDDALVSACRTVLESAGYEVRTASSAKEGLAAAKKDPPDLAVLDVMMESSGAGLTLAQKLRADKKLAGVKLLMITAVGEKTGMNLGSSAGDDFLPVDKFLEKPVDPARLLSEVKSLLGK